MTRSGVADLTVAMADPAVLAALELLSERGLGVTVLHAHDASSDVMVPLKPGIVQFEDDLHVSFLEETHPSLGASVPVTATWRDGAPIIVGRCRRNHA
ncbi:hypothetical protein [Modestobacter sp. I12A-02662]|uniref:hypothetical protein n=1 Tax=Modestobacter sp. I12A-02662 TaxID=1730496 RepID=UPI0034DF59FF